MNIEHLEPAERNPAQLRKTALILLAIILCSGFFVTYAYRQLLIRQQGEFRPQYKQRLTGNFAVVLQDGTTVGLYDLEGKVWMAAMVDFENLDQDMGVLKTLESLSKSKAENKDIHFVLFPVDPNQQKPQNLKSLASERGWEQSRWWIAAAGEEFLHKFVKNRMKMGIYPHQKDQKWVFDRSIVVVDRKMHLRGHFDFEKATKHDVELEQEGASASDKQWVPMLYKHLEKTIEYLLTNER